MGRIRHLAPPRLAGCSDFLRRRSSPNPGVPPPAIPTLRTVKMAHARWRRRSEERRLVSPLVRRANRTSYLRSAYSGISRTA
ncbi:unnamed protein product, partial [Nesidiocoris tenuis]